MPTDAKAIAKTYFDSWKAHDFKTFRSLLADDVTFRGPLGQADNADECTQGIQKLSETVADIQVRKVWADGPDAITWFDLYTKANEHEPVHTANWSHIESGRITSIVVAFDPRSML